MKILRCDRCGKEKSSNRIIGTEFEYHGFKTLSEVHQTRNIKDLCGKCFDDYAEKVYKIKKITEYEQSTWISRLFY